MKDLTTESLEQALINMMTAVDDKGERIDLRPTHYYKENKMTDRIEEIFQQVMNEACPDPLRRFAELVAADEREACAQLCDPTPLRPCDCYRCDCGDKDAAVRVAEWDAQWSMAKAIRARSKHD